MKKTILKSVVATAVVAATMAVSSVATMAANGDAFTLLADDLYTASTTDGGITKEGATITVDKSVTSQAYHTFATSKNKTVKNETGKSWDKEAFSSSAITYTITPYATGSITMYWYDSGAKNVSVGNTSADLSNNTVDFRSDTCIKGTPFTITAESNVAILEISFEPSVGNVYTITGTSNLTEGTFTVGSSVATISGDGSWTATTTDEISVGSKLDIKMDEYTANPESITLTAGSSDNEFIGGNITFTKLELVNITAGEYKPADIEKGLPNFDKSGLTVSGTGKYTGTLSFKLEKPAKVTINAKRGSSDTNVETKYVDFTLGSLNQHIAYDDTSTKDYVAYVPADKNDLVITTSKDSGTTLQVISITIEYIEDGLKDAANGGVYVSGSDSYVIAAINNTDVDEAKITIGKTTFTTDTVYKSVQIGEETIDASQVNGQYLYAIEVKNANGNEALNAFTVE